MIELLVVVVIVSVVLGAVVLKMSGRDDRVLEDAARRSQALIVLACERAAATGIDVGFSLINDRWQFGYLRPQGWLPIADQSSEELRPREIGSNLQHELRREGQLVNPAADAERPQLLCASSGELSPFELRLGLLNQPFRWRIRGLLDGRVELESLDERR